MLLKIHMFDVNQWQVTLKRSSSPKPPTTSARSTAEVDDGLIIDVDEEDGLGIIDDDDDDLVASPCLETEPY